MDGQFLKGIAFKKGKTGGCFLHIVAETPGDHASTLSQKDDAKTESNVSTTPPPNGTEFMDGDIFAFVKGNNVCVCSTVLREGAITAFCRELFTAAKLGDVATMFDLQKIANVDKVKMIKSQGVKKIDLNASLYSATVDYINRKDAYGSLGALGKHFNSLFRGDKKPIEDNLTVSIVINADGRRKIGKQLGANRLESLAKECINSGEDYTIVTGTGQRISQSDIFVRARVEIKRFGKSVDKNKAWKSLEGFYTELHAAGATAQ